MCHVVYLSFELLTKRFRIKLSERINKTVYKLFRVLIVFNLVCFSNIFFRAHSVSHAFHLIKNSLTNFVPTESLSGFIAPLAVGGHQIDEFNFFISILITVLVLLFEKRINSFSKNPVFNITYCVVVLVLIMLFGVFNSGTRFIYMQF
jgi:D-alanyl-lipoteichoic acid acyltransferase DltB (MBOAT superfamily)